MAHTKAQAAVKGNRDSISKRMGVKLFGGQKAKAGNIILRQQGSRVNAGPGTMLARNFSVMALKEGVVRFFKKRGEKFVAVD